RGSNRADRSDVSVLQFIERQTLAGDNVLQIERFMGALNDLSSAIVTPNSLDQCLVRFTGALGDKNVAGPAKVARRFAQGSARQKEFVAERCLPIDQHNIEAMFQVEILQAVVEQQRVRLPFVD